MGKFNERELRMRKERIDAFGDGSVQVVISRPERRALSYREQLPSLVQQLATVEPSRLCGNKDCGNEVRSIDNCVVIFFGTPPAMVTSILCPSCSEKRNEEILPIVREDVRQTFGLGKASADQGSVELDDGRHRSVAQRTVHGVTIHVVEADKYDCGPAKAFCELLQRGMLKRFLFAYQGKHNCFAIVKQIQFDFGDVELADYIKCRAGYCPIITSNGQPLGHHAWVECNGWAIDAASGGLGQSVIFQRIDDYVAMRQLTDIVDYDQYAKMRGGEAGTLTT
ncbi:MULTISPECIES: hypothetical protein [unclassified Bradyrhizobium]|uniref:hypothetical protein n=1 Tax=unclassified Bradyrhizobium TaxID=2631580 RepID=UPI002916ACB1|nr:MULTISPECIES: hypothetical protein [unclassified Bradyrhizobium]